MRGPLDKKPDVWELISQVPVLKSWMPSVGYEIPSSQGKTPNFEFLPDCGLPHQGGVYGKTVSQPFLTISVWFHSCLPYMKESLHSF